ncbi:hypothetical protein EW026_g476 [Hermanssonia centrifuga]|uniref:Cytochrome P450 n=1 Tax=Hermanssonia centrifuga TaxID=98765 RepID=A0A4S4KUJ4_9APHY|nr:hypothetical protein EW026_g476 [Hermanssonia centrifuga]
MLHDPEVYPDPMEFKPERFMASPGREPELDPHSVAFGFGRRICPGLYIADASLFLTVASSLAVFDVTKVIEDGVPVIPIVKQTTGNISHPYPFRCDIKPRFRSAESLIFTLNDE